MVAEIVSAYGDNCAFARFEFPNFPLQAGQFGMSGINLSPPSVGVVHLFERVEGIEGKRFGRSGNGLQIDPLIGDTQIPAALCYLGLIILACVFAPEPELLMDEQQKIRRRRWGSGGICRLRR